MPAPKTIVGESIKDALKTINHVGDEVTVKPNSIRYQNAEKTYEAISKKKTIE